MPPRAGDAAPQFLFSRGDTSNSLNVSKSVMEDAVTAAAGDANCNWHLAAWSLAAMGVARAGVEGWEVDAVWGRGEAKASALLMRLANECFSFSSALISRLRSERT
jgi:hypothetical protein